MELEKKQLLQNIYHDPKSPAAFAGINTLYKEAKKQNPKITKKRCHTFSRR